MDRRPICVHQGRQWHYRRVDRDTWEPDKPVPVELKPYKKKLEDCCPHCRSERYTPYFWRDAYMIAHPDDQVRGCLLCLDCGWKQR